MKKDSNPLGGLARSAGSSDATAHEVVGDYAEVVALIRERRPRLAVALRIAAGELLRFPLPESSIAFRIAELQFALLWVEHELLSLVTAMYGDPSLRVALDKQLAVILVESEKGVPGLVNGLLRAIRNREPGWDQLDEDAIRLAITDFKTHLAPMRADKSFMDGATAIRNAASAHLIGRGGVRLQAAARFVLVVAQQPATPGAVFSSKFAVYAASLDRGLLAVGDAVGLALPERRGPAGQV